MTDPFDDAEEKPLDPAVEQVQRRLRRLMLISALTLGFGIFAVFLAILYRLFTWESSSPATPLAAAPPATAPLAAGAAIPTLRTADLGVSPDARLVSSSLDGNRLLLTYADSQGSILVIIDLPSLTVTARLAVPSGAAP
jgi:hypothetical protein